MTTRTLVREVLQARPEAGFLASGIYRLLRYPGPAVEPVGPGEQTKKPSPVTVAGPRRIHTGFPFLAPMNRDTFSEYSIVMGHAVVSRVPIGTTGIVRYCMTDG